MDRDMDIKEEWVRRAGALLLYVVYESSYMKAYVKLYKEISEQARGG